MTLDPAQQTATSTTPAAETPPVSGGVTPESTSQPAPATTQPAPATQAVETAGHPLFVAHTQDELNAKFGETRQEGKLAAAKAAGFESVEQMTSAMSQYWQFVQQGILQPQDQQPAAVATPQAAATPPTPQTPPAEATPEATTPPPATASTNDAASQELARVKQERQIEHAALKSGADPTKLSDVTSLLSGSLAAQADANGVIPQAQLDAAMTSFFAERPFYKAAPATVGTYSNPPAVAQKTTAQLIAEANARGDTQTVIQLEMSKLNPTPQAVPGQ